MRKLIFGSASAVALVGFAASSAFAQVVSIETFGSGPYPGSPLPSGQTTYTYNAPAQPANFPNILADGEYVLATNTQQGFSSWASIGDNTTGSGYMMLVNADDNQAGEFYRAEVPLTANTSYDFLAYLVTANSQGDFDFCTANEGGLVLPNVTLQVQSTSGVVLASIDTGDIPFNPVPEWEQYQIGFTTDGTTTAVDVVLINNSAGGCGNDLAIDDITFRVAVTMEAFDDIVTLTNTDATQNAVLTLGSNDNLDGNPLPGTELYSVATGSSLPSGFTLNSNTGEVGVPAGTPNGTYTFDYLVCETVNQFNCAVATATIIVDLPPLPITTADDNGSVADSSTGFNAVLNVLDNDTIDSVNSPSDFDLSLAPGATLPSGITFNENTGEVGVLQGTPSGIYTFEYQLCEDGNPTNCEIATVTIDVTNPGGGAFCPIGTAPFPGTYHTVSATGGNSPNGTVGQPQAEGSTQFNGAVTFFGPITMDLTGDPTILVPEGEVIEVVLSSHFGTAGRAEVRMSADGVTYTSLGTTGNGGSVYGAWQSNILRYDDFTVPAGGARFLQVVQQASGVRADGVIYNTQCQPSSTPPTIMATDENETLPFSAAAQTDVLNVIDNDAFDGTTPTVFDLAVNSASSLPPELTFDLVTGEVGIIAGAPAGIYSFEYDICEDGSTTNCETATVTITIEDVSVSELGISKSAATPVLNDNGTYDVTYSLVMENTGTEILNNLQIQDNLAAQMGASFVTSDEGVLFNGVITGPSVVLTNTSGASAAPTANTADYDGGANDGLLIGTDGELAPGDFLTVTFTAVLNPNIIGAATTFENIATGSADDGAGVSVSDVSNDGTDPALSPGETIGSPTPVNLPLTLPDTIAQPAQCGAFNHSGWLTRPIRFANGLVEFGSGDPQQDPYTITALQRDADGRILSYFGTPDEVISGAIPTRAGAELATDPTTLFPNSNSEYHLSVFRLEGAPNTAESVTFDGNGASDNSYVWVEDSAGNVIYALPQFLWTTGNGDGADFAVPFTYPADGIAFVYAGVFDPTSFYSQYTLSDYECPTPSLAMTKVADNPGPYAAGEMITYTYTVTNDGNQIVRDIAINDTHNGSDPAPTPGSETLLTDATPTGDSTDAATDGSWDALAPGDTITFTGTYIVTQADVNNL